jgi:hypothetical protein
MSNRITLMGRSIFAAVLAAALLGGVAAAFADDYGHDWDHGHAQDRDEWREHHAYYYYQPGYAYPPPPPPPVVYEAQPVYAPPVAPTIGLFFNIR